MAIIDPIYNTESALSVRNKLNDSFLEVNKLIHTAQASEPIPAGCAVMILANTKAALATNNVLGLAKTTVATGSPLDIAKTSLTLANWSAVTGSALLTPGSVYFLSHLIAGHLTKVPPTDSGQRCIRVGKAVNTTTLSIEISQPVLL